MRRWLGVLPAMLLAACGEEARPTCSVGRGDLVLTEIMSDPAGTDTGGEYVELYNASQRELDVAGATLAVSRLDGSSTKTHDLGSHVLPAGGYLALGDADPARLPAHLDEGYGRALGSLVNSGAILELWCGDQLVDQVRYDRATRSGHARILDGAARPDADANDAPSAWCEAASKFADGAFGTPGAANAPCAVADKEGDEGARDGADAGAPAPPGCLDADGAHRAPVAPRPGDLVITEIMANPEAVGDTAGEWFEVYVVNPVDLAGLALASESVRGRTVLDGSQCLHASAGSWLVFARDADPANNGGLESVAATFGFSLGNASSSTGPRSLSLQHSGEVIDSITWTESEPGASLQLDVESLDSASNDASENLCFAGDWSHYGRGDFGTPGAVNGWCP